MKTELKLWPVVVVFLALIFVITPLKIAPAFEPVSRDLTSRDVILNECYKEEVQMGLRKEVTEQSEEKLAGMFAAARELVRDLIKREGGYVDHPADTGGPTKYGITLTTYAHYKGRPVDSEDLRNLTDAEAELIYLNHYFVQHNLAMLAHLGRPLAAVLIDSIVLHGPTRTIRWLQGLVGARQDGRIGPSTARAVDDYILRHGGTNTLIKRLTVIRLEHVAHLVESDTLETQRGTSPEQHRGVFLLGWTRRICSFLPSI